VELTMLVYPHKTEFRVERNGHESWLVDSTEAVSAEGPGRRMVFGGLEAAGVLPGCGWQDQPRRL